MDDVERLRTKVENYPSPSAYNRLAEILRISGDRQGAIDIARQGIKEFPRNGQGYVILATIELGQGHRDQALELLQTSVERDPRCYGGYRMLADLLVENDDLAGAIACLERILAFKPHDEAVAQQLADLKARAPQSAPAANRAAAEDTDAIELFASATARPSAAVARTPTPRSTARPLDSLANEDAVRGAVIADGQGRALADAGLPDGQGDLLAALAAEVSTSAEAAAAATGAGALCSWSIIASDGQALAYRHGGDLAVIALAERSAKPALIELRARQALLDLGGR